MRTDDNQVLEQLTAIRQHLAAIEQQQKLLCDLLLRLLPIPEERRTAEPAPAPPQAAAQNVLADCSKDIVEVLRSASHPLTTLEILEELVRRQSSWRENLVRHALTHLLDEGVVVERNDLRPHSYATASRP